MPDKNYLIVFNPQSGRKGVRFLKKISAVLDAKNIRYELFQTESDTCKSENRLNKIIHNFSNVISLGGDGTLNMLSNVLAYTNIPLGIIPCGTGNDFARHVYKHRKYILDVVTGDTVKKVDLGWCNDRYFINVLGVGYDAMIAEKTRNNNKIIFRSFFYLWNALKYLLFYKEKTVHLESPGFNKNEAAFMAVFGNASFFGNGMNITPQADITDGLLDCCWVGKLGFIRKCQCLIKLFSGEHLTESNIEYVQAKAFQVLSKGHPIEADGEFIGYTPASIQIREQALLLKVQ